MKLKISEEVKMFIRSLPPEPRRMVSRKLDTVLNDTLAIEGLEEPLERFYKLKAGKFRIICAIESNTVYALFAERRSIVYEILTSSLLEEILQRQKKN